MSLSRCILLSITIISFAVSLVFGFWILFKVPKHYKHEFTEIATTQNLYDTICMNATLRAQTKASAICDDWDHDLDVIPLFEAFRKAGHESLGKVLTAVAGDFIVFILIGFGVANCILSCCFCFCFARVWSQDGALPLIRDLVDPKLNLNRKKWH